MRLPHHSSNPLTTAARFNSWLALWVMLAMLGQALLPTLGYLRSNSSPELWNEICSVVGVRQKSQSENDAPTTAPHADCPLCLQVFHGAILDTAQVSTLAVFVLLSHISFTVTEQHSFKLRAALPEARAPPEFN